MRIAVLILGPYYALEITREVFHLIWPRVWRLFLPDSKIETLKSAEET